MKRTTTTRAAGATAMMQEAFQDVEESFERFFLKAGLATLTGMLEADAAALCGPRHGRSPERAGHRWGRTRSKIAFHGGRVDVERPRVRSRGGVEIPLPSWEAAESEDGFDKILILCRIERAWNCAIAELSSKPGGEVSI